MSLIPLTPDLIDTFSIKTHARRQFSSSSISGIGGAVRVFPDMGSSQKEVPIFSTEADRSNVIEDEEQTFSYPLLDNNFESLRRTLVGFARNRLHNPENSYDLNKLLVFQIFILRTIKMNRLQALSGVLLMLFMMHFAKSLIYFWQKALVVFL